MQTNPMDSFLSDFRSTLESAGERLRLRDEQWARDPLKPGGWSPVEVIGHLVDSASNNHQRFVRAQFRHDLCAPGYEQNDWVGAQAYREAKWEDLLTLWSSFNLHLVHVIAHMSGEALHAERPEHDLERIAWETVPATEPVTLAYFVRDYYGHLCHHLRQIDMDLAPEPVLQRAGGTRRGS